MLLFSFILFVVGTLFKYFGKRNGGSSPKEREIDLTLINAGKVLVTASIVVLGLWVLIVLGGLITLCALATVV